MFEAFFKKKRPDAVGVGIALFPNQAAIAVVDGTPGKKPVVQICDFFEEKTRFWEVLASKIEQYHLNKKPICFVLNHEQYSLQLVEAPLVESSEMKQAIRWRLKEFVSYPVEEALYDLFPLYDAPPAGRPQLLYVAFANRKQLAPLYQFIENYHLEIHAFDIQELVLRNLLVFLADKKESVALLQLTAEEGHLNIFQDERLFFLRAFSQGYLALKQNNETVWEEFFLEIQRSLDYFETRFMQQPVTQLFLVCESDDAMNFVEKIQARFSLKVENLDLQSLFEGETSIIPKNSNTIYALGAALRVGLEP